VAAACLGLALSAPACSKPPAGPGENGGRLQLVVDGKTVTLEKSVLELELRTDRSQGLTVFSHDPEMNRLVLEFPGQGASEADFIGKPLAIDFQGENAEKHRMGTEWNVNRFTHGGKYYEGYRLSGTLVSLDQGRGTVELSGVVLEFPDDPDHDSDEGSAVPGREVTVSARATLPVEVFKD
jgi:hypothetical protein